MSRDRARQVRCDIAAKWNTRPAPQAGEAVALGRNWMSQHVNDFAGHFLQRYEIQGSLREGMMYAFVRTFDGIKASPVSAKEAANWPDAAPQGVRDAIVEECAAYHDERVVVLKERLARVRGPGFQAIEGRIGSTGFSMSGNGKDELRESLRMDIAFHEESAVAIRALKSPAMSEGGGG